MEKTEGNLKSQKLKLIYKEKLKKLSLHRRSEEGSVLASAKSSSKTNSWS
jgi:hypothetical protein